MFLCETTRLTCLARGALLIHPPASRCANCVHLQPGPQLRSHHELCAHSMILCQLCTRLVYLRQIARSALLVSDILGFAANRSDCVKPGRQSQACVPCFFAFYEQLGFLAQNPTAIRDLVVTARHDACRSGGLLLQAAHNLASGLAIIFCISETVSIS